MIFKNKKLFERLILVFICFLPFFLRVPSFLFPLDYDVGGHLFYGMMVSTKGFYSTLQEIRPVGLLAIFALIYKIFGNSTFYVNAVGAIFWSFSTLLVYKLSKLVFSSKKVSFLSALIFAFFSSSRALQGEMANLETFFIPFSLLGLVLFFLFRENKKKTFLFLSGFSFGVSFLIKHLAIFDFIVVFLYGLFLIFIPQVKLIEPIKKIKKLFIENVILLIGFMSIIILVSLYFFLKGQVKDFYYWQFFNIYSGTSEHRFLGSAFVNLKNNFFPIFKKTYFFWILGLLGFFSTITFKAKSLMIENFKRIFLLFWILVVFSGMYYLWWFFPHHFLQLTPAISIFAGLGIYDLYNLGKKKFKKRYFSIKNIFTDLFLLIFLFLFLRADTNYFLGYFKEIRGEITKKEYLALVGKDVSPAGWLPLYDTADYLNKVTKHNETVFAWTSVPTIYALIEKQPISWFVYKYPLLPDELRTNTFKGWFSNVGENKEKLMSDLVRVSPDFIIIEVEPRKIFDEMNSFADFSNFVFKNYSLDRKFGNILIYKKENRIKKLSIENNPLIPIEIIELYSAITKVEVTNNQTIVTFEPMVNTSGLIKVYKISYPSSLPIVFNPVSAEFLGQDGNDFVNWAEFVPSGIMDLHIRVKGENKPSSFIRVKASNGFYWNTQHYGVNSVLKLIQNEDVFDLFFEFPTDWENNNFEVYIIYEDGSFSRIIL